MAATKTSKVIVQYIALRGDLLKVMKWPLGAVVAQACHASIAAIVSHGEEESVKAYTHKDNMNSMHKVVVEVGPTIVTLYLWSHNFNTSNTCKESSSLLSSMSNICNGVSIIISINQSIII